MKSSVELFTGCGGLAMGLSRAGYTALRMVEWDRHSVTNIKHNRDNAVEHVKHWPIHQEDVRSVKWEQYRGTDLVAGGPPCQPFSVGGKHQGHDDHRDMWPEAIRAVREIRPQAFVFENVRGLTRVAFAEYLEWIKHSLQRPDIIAEANETKADHLHRLRTAGPPHYRISVNQVNAADFGAAQKRHRVVILGIHGDLAPYAPRMKPTHSRERLLWDQWISGEYWERHGIRRPAAPDRLDAALVSKLRRDGVAPDSLPWRTVRDAIAGLGAPGSGTKSNHALQPGARSYPGHTGSPLDMPAKALKAGVHGVPGGENTILTADGGIRYLTVREAARLQGMPDEYEFIGSWSENMRQLGNAVPTQLAQAAVATLDEVLYPNTANKRQAA